MPKLSGKKTYAVVALMMLYAVSAGLLGHIDANSAAQVVLEALAIAGLRAGVAKSAPKGEND